MSLFEFFIYIRLKRYSNFFLNVFVRLITNIILKSVTFYNFKLAFYFLKKSCHINYFDEVGNRR